MQIPSRTVAIAAIAAVSGAAHAQNLRAEWYWESRTIRRLAEIDWDTPDLETNEAAIAWERTGGSWFEGAPRDRFAVRLTGTIEIPTSGEWTFWLHSDDGSDLAINGRRVVNNDGLHSMRLRSGKIHLEAGTHEITVRYFENGGHAGLAAYWKGPGMNSRESIEFGESDGGSESGSGDSSVGGALTDSGLDGPIRQATAWRAGEEGARAWFGRDFEGRGGVAALTRASRRWEGRVLLQAVPMPPAGTFRYELKTRYANYYNQLHYWHILAANEGAQVKLDYPGLHWNFRSPHAVSVHREYSRPGEEGDPWHTFEREFTVAPEVAAEHDYLVFAFMASMRPGQFAEVDSVLLDLSRFHEHTEGGLAEATTDSAAWASTPLCADFTGDGRPDVLLTGSRPALLVQQPDGSLVQAGLTSAGMRGQCGAADFDNDGDLDVWSAAAGHVSDEGLLRNGGPGAFAFLNGDELGFGEPSNNRGLFLADVDGDGRCDVVQCSANGNWTGHNLGPGEDEGSVSFEALERDSTGLNGAGAFGNGEFVSSGDVNGDGIADFFYNYDGGRLFLSSEDGGYSEAVGAIAIGQTQSTGSAWADYDNDGDLDLFVARLDAGQPCQLFRQNVDGSFSDVAASAGITTTAGHRSACWGDWENDGDLDLVVLGAGEAPHVLYLNRGDGTFVEEPGAIPVSGDGSDALFADYDNDGDLDLFITHIGSGAQLLENWTDTDRYLKVRVVGAGHRGTNAAGVGVRVDLLTPGGGLIARRDLGAMRGFGGQEPLWAHFGGVLPSATYVVRAHFASGEVTETVVPAAAASRVGSVVVPQMVTIVEPEPKGLRLIQWQETDPSR